MAHREADTAALLAEEPKTGTLWLADLEPVLGLVAALGRFNQALTASAVSHLPSDAVEALSAIQGIMWRLEHSRPDLPTSKGDD